MSISHCVYEFSYELCQILGLLSQPLLNFSFAYSSIIEILGFRLIRFLNQDNSSEVWAFGCWECGLWDLSISDSLVAY